MLAFSVQIKNLTKQYHKGPLALSGVSLDIQTGLFGLLGPNGAGKTTLMRILATLLLPTAGEVQVGNTNLRANPGAVRKVLGYLPQDFNTYKHLSVVQVLDYVALLKGETNTAARARSVAAILEQINLHNTRHVRVGELSGGMKQRLGIGQALLGQPQLLIVDEPTAGLDPEERIRFRNLLSEISQNRVVILSTHIVGDVESCCYRLAVLNQGCVRFTGTPAELAARAQRRVWEVETPENSHIHIPNSARVITTRRLANTWQLRVLSGECPLPGATQVPPGLEEGYLAVVGVGGEVQ